jgi:hypothetical protein
MKNSSFFNIENIDKHREHFPLLPRGKCSNSFWQVSWLSQLLRPSRPAFIGQWQGGYAKVYSIYYGVGITVAGTAPGFHRIPSSLHLNDLLRCKPKLP